MGGLGVYWRRGLCNEEKEELEEDGTGPGVGDAAVHPEDSKYSRGVWDGELAWASAAQYYRRLGRIGVARVIG
jgi:hypothetical protein